ncbi:MAG: hypothetical protein K0Q73_9322 [Paenibacillus sp.]|nr:hypothetical protein [Paenibacillus sp.]
MKHETNNEGAGCDSSFSIFADSPVKLNHTISDGEKLKFEVLVRLWNRLNFNLYGLWV